MPSVPIALFLIAALLAVGCFVDTAPTGLRATPPGDGATIVFDLARRPVPEIPTPNDVATVADPTSRTGIRINVSLTASTQMERRAREGFDDMEGWGTFAPITMAFSPGLAAPAGAPALDLEDLAARMRGDGWDFSNDPVYVINLRTGVPVALDLGEGNFPVTVAEPNRYWANDPHAKEQNLLFETLEEGPGLTQRQYSPQLDTDFDGVLDHPNTFGLASPGKIRGVDDVMTWYERETDTLILRPVVPMEEKTEYAVVVTDRLRGSDGKEVRSPFSYVHHPWQKAGVARLASILASGEHAAYYGDLARTGLDHVAFAWTFTTQPVYEDMRLLRDGLYGNGPFAKLSTDFPPEGAAFRAAGLARAGEEEPAAWQSDARCISPSKSPFVVKMDDAKTTIHELIGKLLTLKGPSAVELESSIVDNIDHFVIGSFKAPYYMGDPEHEDANARFRLNYKTGEGNVHADTVQFWLAVPREKLARQPFSTVMWSHGTAQNGAEILLRAGYFARHGLATFGINMPGHGLVLDKGLETVAEVFLRQTCLVPWVSAITQHRARDLNADGTADSGGLLWTAHIFHSRDNVRQSVLDQVAATRLVRSFDGQLGTQDYDGDGAPNLAGDFDGNGTPDVGGKGVKFFSAGDSYGGIVAQVHGAVDPFISAVAPISGGGGLIDVATRSALVPESVFEQILSPLVVSIPASDIPKYQNGPDTACSDGERSVRFVVNNLVKSEEIEIACLTQAELDSKKTVVVTNLDNKEVRCARTAENGRFRVPLAANVGDRIDVQIYDKPDVVESYKGCKVLEGAPAGRRITTWEKPTVIPHARADDAKTCEAKEGCAIFQGSLFPVGSPLVSPNEGLGLQRQSPDLRRLMNLTQAAIDPADPINFAPYYMLRPNPGLDGEPLPPRPVLSSNTVGDKFVPVESGNAFARAAGALPFLPPSALASYPEYADYVTPQSLYDAWGGKTPNQVLIEGHGIESLSRLGRTRAGPRCSMNYQTSDACASPPDPSETCDKALFDSDWHSEGQNRYDAPHPDVPLRLARIATLRPTDAPSLAKAWAPRLNGWGKKDGAAWAADAPVIAVVNAYTNPLGQHVWTFGDPCKAFDDAIYYDHLVGRFFATSGHDVYFLSHPESHRCMAMQNCPFLK